MTFIRGNMPELYDNQRRSTPKKIKPFQLPKYPAPQPPPSKTKKAK